MVSFSSAQRPDGFNIPELRPDIIKQAPPSELTENPILRNLQEGIKYHEIETLLSKSSGEIPYPLLQQLQEISKDLPTPPQTGNREKWIKFARDGLNNTEVELKGSIDLGGHGGTLRAKIKTDSGETKYLFLKPKDSVEALNYRVIQRIAPEVAKYMPTVYGEVMVGGETYLVMENSRVDQKGNELKQIADIKLAGKVPGLQNPIARQTEMQVTRETKKSPFSFGQMLLGARLAPNYMIAKGSKALRIFSYGRSKGILQNSLKGLNPHQVNSLRQQLRTIQEALYQSPVALIGASIILIEETNGYIKPLLIDPAHMEVSEDRRIDANEVRKENDPNIFFSNQDQKLATLQRDSNWIALRSLIGDICVQQTAQEIFKKGKSFSERKFSIRGADTNILLRIP